MFARVSGLSPRARYHDVAGLPMSKLTREDLGTNAPRPVAKPYGTLSFVRHGKSHRRAEKCGGSMYCHCHTYYAADLAGKEDAMKMLFKSAHQAGNVGRMDIGVTSIAQKEAFIETTTV